MPIPQPACRDIHNAADSLLRLIRTLPVRALVAELQTEIVHGGDPPHRMTEPVNARNIERDGSQAAASRSTTSRPTGLPVFRFTGIFFRGTPGSHPSASPTKAEFRSRAGLAGAGEQVTSDMDRSGCRRRRRY